MHTNVSSRLNYFESTRKVTRKKSKKNLQSVSQFKNTDVVPRTGTLSYHLEQA